MARLTTTEKISVIRYEYISFDIIRNINFKLLVENFKSKMNKNYYFIIFVVLINLWVSRASRLDLKNKNSVLVISMGNGMDLYYQ